MIHVTINVHVHVLVRTCRNTCVILRCGTCSTRMVCWCVLTARGPVRHRRRANDLQHRAGDHPAEVHVCYHRCTAIQGVTSLRAASSLVRARLGLVRVDCGWHDDNDALVFAHVNSCLS